MTMNYKTLKIRELGIINLKKSSQFCSKMKEIIAHLRMMPSVTRTRLVDDHSLHHW